MALPKISVLMPAFNHAPFIEAAIESVLNQSFDAIELIIIDDASSDGTWSKLQGYADNPRVRLYRHEQNLGAHITLNEALEYSRGQRIAIINSDDIFMPERLQACSALLDEGADLVATDIQLINSCGKDIDSHWWIEAYESLKAVYLDTSDWATTFLAGNMLMTSSNFVFERKVIDALGGFRNFRYVLDYEFLLRLFAAGFKTRWLDSKLLKYRLHESNTISDSPLNANRECNQLLRETAYRIIGCPTDSMYLQRWKALARQLSRNEQYIIEIQLAQKHMALVEQEQNWRHDVDERDAWVAERDASIAERDSWIADRDASIAERDSWIADRDASIAERDSWITEKDALLARYKERFDPVLAIVGWDGAKLLEYPARGLGKLMALFRDPKGKLKRLFSLDTKLQIAPVRLSSISALQQWLDKNLPNIECVSFDVFDTLISRCIEPPEWLHKRVAEEVAKHLGNGWRPDAVLALRQAEESSLRAQAIAEGSDHECHFEKLVEGWARRLYGEDCPELTHFIHQTERNLESLALSAKPGVLPLLEFLHQNNVKVIAVSDMYLGHEHIRQLLNDCGLSEYIERIYVSADFGLAKYSGRLHAKVLEAESLSANKMVHIGDNLISDMLRPCSLGIQGIFLDERRERVRRRHQQLSAEMANEGGIWPGRMLNEIVSQRLNNDPFCSTHQRYFNLGLTVLGPLFSTFILGLIERLHETKPERIYFLARDGYLFKTLYERYLEATQNNEKLPQPDYLYVSRRVLSSASVATGMTLAQAQVAFYNPKQQGLLSICKAYGLKPDALSELASEHGIEAMEIPIADWNDSRLVNFLNDERVQLIIRSSGLEARALLKEYLAQNGFFSAERVAFIDIGWNGTIQKFLVEAFATEQGFPELHGYYYALGTEMHGQFQHGGSIEGLLMDARHHNPCERAPSDFEELFEQGARALEATTLGYKKTGQTIYPILKSDDSQDRLAELACNPFVSAMQDGVKHYFKHFLVAQKLTGFNFQQLRPYALGLAERAVVYPDTNEVNLLGKLSHTEDFGHDEVLDLKTKSFTLRDLFRPRLFYRRTQGLPWRYAPFAGAYSPWSAWLVRYTHLRRVLGLK